MKTNEIKPEVYLPLKPTPIELINPLTEREDGLVKGDWTMGPSKIEPQTPNVNRTETVLDDNPWPHTRKYTVPKGKNIPKVISSQLVQHYYPDSER